MSEHKVHGPHDHVHGDGCGHATIEHDGHKDFLHDGHLHHPHDGHVDEHVLEVSAANPADCTPNHACGGHGADHAHGPACGHEAVAHGDHTDYIVNGHLHHAHADAQTPHCDDHGKVAVA